jgi:hypothetical protein
MFLAIEAFDGSIGFFVRSELDESKALAATGFPIGNDFGAFDCAELTKNLLKFAAIDLIAKVTNIQLAAH